jgi:hypothetical protein
MLASKYSPTRAYIVERTLNCGAVLLSNAFSWTITAGASSWFSAIEYGTDTMWRDIGISVVDIGSRCFLFESAPPLSPTIAMVEWLTWLLYDVMVYESMLHALIRLPRVDVITFSYYLTELLIYKGGTFLSRVAIVWHWLTGAPASHHNRRRTPSKDRKKKDEEQEFIEMAQGRV